MEECHGGAEDVKHVKLSQNLLGLVDEVKHDDDPDMLEVIFCFLHI